MKLMKISAPEWELAPVLYDAARKVWEIPTPEELASEELLAEWIDRQQTLKKQYIPDVYQMIGEQESRQFLILTGASQRRIWVSLGSRGIYSVTIEFPGGSTTAAGLLLDWLLEDKVAVSKQNWHAGFKLCFVDSSTHKLTEESRNFLFE